MRASRGPLLQRLSMYRLRADVRLGADRPAGAARDRPRAGGRAARSAAPGDGLAALRGRRAATTAPTGTPVRVAHVIPETGIELTPETYILEAGFERLHGVDFRKGCYVGQEVTARMKHKTELRKGLVQVAVEGAAPVGTPILTGGRARGGHALHPVGRAGHRADAVRPGRARR